MYLNGISGSRLNAQLLRNQNIAHLARPRHHAHIMADAQLDKNSLGILAWLEKVLSRRETCLHAECQEVSKHGHDYCIQRQYLTPTPRPKLWFLY